MGESSGGRVPWLRIAIEGLVIVGSILLAFAIDAAWERAQDRDREADYLRLLATDLRQTLENNDRFHAVAVPIDLATAGLARAYYQPNLPPTDTLRAWFAQVGAGVVVQPRLGTVQSLVSTGDLSLIRSDSLRAAITRYLTDITAFEGFEEDGREQFELAREQLTHYVDLELVRARALATRMVSESVRDSITSLEPLSILPTGPLRSLPPVPVEALVRDPEVHRILVEMSREKRSMANWRQLMRARSEALLTAVDEELSHREAR